MLIIFAFFYIDQTAECHDPPGLIATTVLFAISTAVLGIILVVICIARAHACACIRNMKEKLKPPADDDETAPFAKDHSGVQNDLEK